MRAASPSSPSAKVPDHPPCQPKFLEAGRAAFCSEFRLKPSVFVVERIGIPPVCGLRSHWLVARSMDLCRSNQDLGEGMQGGLIRQSAFPGSTSIPALNPKTL